MPNTLHRYLAICAVLIAGLCTTIMNWRFSFRLGANEFDAYVWATFSVALDICKWTMLPCVALTWRIHKQRALSALAIWLIATCYSFAAAIGFAAVSRETTAAERKHRMEIHATLNTMKQSPRWQSSAACSDVTTKQSRDFCETYRGTEAKLRSLPQHDDDPQSRLVARLTGLTDEQARLMLAIVLALACELVSALGFFAILFSPHRVSNDRETRTSDGCRLAFPAEARTPKSVSTDLAPPRWRPRNS